jgi:peptidoglycan/xylan/chitin deacetylase (PgdA/CDA1 family)
MSDAPRVALTFDAEHPDRPRCPPDAFERIVDALDRHRARATFFVQGRWAEAYPDRARRIAEAGHLIGHHSHYHARMPLLHDDGIRADVEAAADAISRCCGVDPRPWFRCPFGEGHDDARVLGRLAELGYRNVHWDVELEDWEPWTTADRIVRGAVDGALEHGDGAIVLLHTWPGPTADAVADVLDGLADAGMAFVGIDGLADRRTGTASVAPEPR